MGAVSSLQGASALGTRELLSIDELEAEVLRLGAEDRARLLERLIASFEPDSRVERAWVAEALRREAEISSGKVKLVPGAEAVARVRALIR
jgi:putative addiction module component (TIGR02574 family)